MDNYDIKTKMTHRSKNQIMKIMNSYYCGLNVNGLCRLTYLNTVFPVVGTV